MCLSDHRTTLLSLHVVNFSGRTDTETGGDFISCSQRSSHSLARPAHYTHGSFWSLHSYWRFPPVVLPQSCDAHWCPLPFEIILVHNFLFLVKENKAFNIGMGPKTVGPWRKPVKIFEVKIDFRVPQITTFLFKNLLRSVSPKNAGWPSKPRGSYWKEGRNQSKGFLHFILQISFWVSFLVRCVFRKKYSRVSGQLSSQVRQPGGRTDTMRLKQSLRWSRSCRNIQKPRTCIFLYLCGFKTLVLRILAFCTTLLLL